MKTPKKLTAILSVAAVGILLGFLSVYFGIFASKASEQLVPPQLTEVSNLTGSTTIESSFTFADNQIGKNPVCDFGAQLEPISADRDFFFMYRKNPRTFGQMISQIKPNEGRFRFINFGTYANRGVFRVNPLNYFKTAFNIDLNQGGYCCSSLDSNAQFAEHEVLIVYNEKDTQICANPTTDQMLNPTTLNINRTGWHLLWVGAQTDFNLPRGTEILAVWSPNVTADSAPTYVWDYKDGGQIPNFLNDVYWIYVDQPSFESGMPGVPGGGQDGQGGQGGQNQGGDIVIEITNIDVGNITANCFNSLLGDGNTVGDLNNSCNSQDIQILGDQFAGNVDPEQPVEVEVPVEVPAGTPSILISQPLDSCDAEATFNVIALDESNRPVQNFSFTASNIRNFQIIPDNFQVNGNFTKGLNNRDASFKVLNPLVGGQAATVFVENAQGEYNELPANQAFEFTVEQPENCPFVLISIADDKDLEFCLLGEETFTEPVFTISNPLGEPIEFILAPVEGVTFADSAGNPINPDVAITVEAGNEFDVYVTGEVALDASIRINNFAELVLIADGTEIQILESNSQEDTTFTLNFEDGGDNCPKIVATLFEDEEFYVCGEPDNQKVSKVAFTLENQSSRDVTIDTREVLLQNEEYLGRQFNKVVQANTTIEVIAENVPPAVGGEVEVIMSFGNLRVDGFTVEESQALIEYVYQENGLNEGDKKQYIWTTFGEDNCEEVVMELRNLDFDKSNEVYCRDSDPIDNGDRDRLITLFGFNSIYNELQRNRAYTFSESLFRDAEADFEKSLFALTIYNNSGADIENLKVIRINFEDQGANPLVTYWNNSENDTFNKKSELIDVNGNRIDQGTAASYLMLINNFHDNSNSPFFDNDLTVKNVELIDDSGQVIRTIEKNFDITAVGENFAYENIRFGQFKFVNNCDRTASSEDGELVFNYKNLINRVSNISEMIFGLDVSFAQAGDDGTSSEGSENVSPEAESTPVPELNSFTDTLVDLLNEAVFTSPEAKTKFIDDLIQGNLFKDLDTYVQGGGLTVAFSKLLETLFLLSSDELNSYATATAIAQDFNFNYLDILNGLKTIVTENDQQLLTSQASQFISSNLADVIDKIKNQRADISTQIEIENIDLQGAGVDLSDLDRIFGAPCADEILSVNLVDGLANGSTFKFFLTDKMILQSPESQTKFGAFNPLSTFKSDADYNFNTYSYDFGSESLDSNFLSDELNNFKKFLNFNRYFNQRSDILSTQILDKQFVFHLVSDSGDVVDVLNFAPNDSGFSLQLTLDGELEVGKYKIIAKGLNLTEFYFDQYLLFDGIYTRDKLIDFEYLNDVDPANFDIEKKYLNDFVRFLFRNFNEEILEYRENVQFKDVEVLDLVKYIFETKQDLNFDNDPNNMQANVCSLVGSLSEENKNFYSELCIDYPVKIDFEKSISDFFHSLSVKSKECYEKMINNFEVSQKITSQPDEEKCVVSYKIGNLVQKHLKPLKIDNLVLPSRNIDSCNVEFSINGIDYTTLNDNKNKLLGQSRLNLENLSEFIFFALPENIINNINQNQSADLLDAINQGSNRLLLSFNNLLVDLLNFELQAKSLGSDFILKENNELSAQFKDLLNGNASDVETMFYIMKSELLLDSSYNTLYDLLRISVGDFEQSFGAVATLIANNQIFANAAEKLQSDNRTFTDISSYAVLRNRFPLRIFANDDLYSRYASTRDSDFQKFIHNDNGFVASLLNNDYKDSNSFIDDRFLFSPFNSLIKTSASGLKRFDMSEFVYQPTLNKIPLSYLDQGDNTKKYFYLNSSQENSVQDSNSNISNFLFKSSKDYLSSSNVNCNQDCINALMGYQTNNFATRKPYLTNLANLLNDDNLTQGQTSLVNSAFDFVSNYKKVDLTDDVQTQSGHTLYKVFSGDPQASKLSVVHAYLPDSLLYLPFHDTSKTGLKLEPFDMNKTVDNFELRLNEFERILDLTDVSADLDIYYSYLIDDFRSYITEIKQNTSLFYGEFDNPNVFGPLNLASNEEKEIFFRFSPKEIIKDGITNKLNADCEVYFPNAHMSNKPSLMNEKSIFGGALVSTNDEYANSFVSEGNNSFQTVRYLFYNGSANALGPISKTKCELYTPDQSFDEVFTPTP